MIKIRAEKISSNSSKFRTPLQDLDYLIAMPEVGKSLLLGSSTHESGGIVTSPLVDVERVDNVIVCETKNSIYKLTILEGE